MDVELRVSVPQGEIRELLRAMNKIMYPDVTYCEDSLEMANQAIRLNKVFAENGEIILGKWLGV